MKHLNSVAKRKVSGPDEWEWCKWERIGEGNDFVVEGGVPRLLKSGPRKGEKTWKGVETQKTVVTDAEIKAEHARYEQDTGNCGDCMGSGRVFARWSADNGEDYKPCSRCGSTGKAPGVENAA
jgi:hypothetical protein